MRGSGGDSDSGPTPRVADDSSDSPGLHTVKRLLLLAALIPAGIGCQYVRKFAASRERPPNALSVADYEASRVRDESADAPVSPRTTEGAASRGAAKTKLVGWDEPIDRAQEPKRRDAEPAPVPKESNREAANPAVDDEPAPERSGWASFLPGFAKPKRIPFPRTDLGPHRTENGGSRQTVPSDGFEGI